VVPVAIKQLQLQLQDTVFVDQGTLLYHVICKRLLIVQQVLVNQALFTPLFNSYFFGMQSLLSGATVPEIIERIKNTVPTSWINSCKVWPMVTAFSFTYIPIQYRSIFGGVIAIGWQTYLSLLNTRAAAQEEKEHLATHDTSVGVRTTHARVEHRMLEQKCAA
jgi:protein Mpv17